jgi:quercetin dioxygenase-like cupin family protein
MRLVVPSSATNATFAVAEFRGGPGPWTVPHIHERMEESFYVTEGTFTFTCGTEEIHAEPGSLVLVPRGTPHLITGGPNGGACLTLFVPGGLEEMFLELGRLPPGGLTDPDVRAEIAKRHDSVPVN